MRRRAWPLGLALALLAAPALAEPAAGGGGLFFSDPLPLRFNVRGGLLLRNDRGYDTDARVFAETPQVTTTSKVSQGSPIPPAGGVEIEAGAAVLPRLSVFGSFASYTNGISETESQITLTTQRVGLDLRYAFLRASGGEDLWIYTFELEASAGVGYYIMKEGFIDRAIFDATLNHSDESVGGRFGIDATGYYGPLGAVIGYAYHTAGASISDRLGSSLSAGGHEFTLGLAFRY